MLYWEIIAVCSEIHKEDTKTLCGQNVQFVNVKLGVSGPDSVIGTATDYGLDSAGIEFRWGRDFPQLFRPALGPTQPPVQWVSCLSRG